MALVGALRDRDAATIADEVAAAAVDHQHGSTADDIAVVVVRYVGSRHNPVTGQRERRSRAVPGPEILMDTGVAGHTPDGLDP